MVGVVVDIELSLSDLRGGAMLQFIAFMKPLKKEMCFNVFAVVA